MEMLTNLDPILKTYWLIAIPASLIFIIQTVMTFMVGDAGDGVSADFEGNLEGADAPFQLFSLRNFINFLLGFSWTGISFYHYIPNAAILMLIALAIGILFVYIFFLVIQQIQKLAEDNSFKYSSTLHKTAEVYITIPAHKSGKGKIMISINGSFHELEAITEKEAISTGSLVKIVKIENETILVVETI